MRLQNENLKEKHKPEDRRSESDRENSGVNNFL
jgi:hypothetical protein